MERESKTFKIINLAKQLYIQNFMYSYPIEGSENVLKVIEEECKDTAKACLCAAKAFYKTVEEESNNNGI